MSAPDYLATLDLDQLCYAKDRADELIAAREQKRKRVVWCVEGPRPPATGLMLLHRRDVVECRTFPEEGYLQAAEFLVQRAREKAAMQPGLRPYNMQLELKPDFVTEREYRDLFDEPSKGQA